MPDVGPSYSTGKGPYRMQTANWPGSSPVAVGDFVYKSSSDRYDYSAAVFPWDTNIATTQANFHDVFRGVSQVRRTASQTTAGTQATDGCIAATGEFMFPCDALGAAVYVANNQYVTIAQGTGNTLNPQKVVATTDVTLAIGKLTRDAAAGQTWLCFEIVPTTGPASNGLVAMA